MSPAVKLCLLSAGAFFMTGLLTGTWKYLCIRKSPEYRAPVYVDIAHRAALLYSFAALLLARFAEYSPWSTGVTVTAAAFPIFYFGFAIVAYVIHGALQDTDNQLAPPHRLGPLPLSSGMMAFLMWSLIVGEIGGTGVLLWGFVRSVLLTG